MLSSCFSHHKSVDFQGRDLFFPKAQKSVRHVVLATPPMFFNDFHDIKLLSTLFLSINRRVLIDFAKRGGRVDPTGPALSPPRPPMVRSKASSLTSTSIALEARFPSPGLAWERKAHLFLQDRW